METNQQAFIIFDRLKRHGVVFPDNSGVVIELALEEIAVQHCSQSPNGNHNFEPVGSASVCIYCSRSDGVNH